MCSVAETQRVGCGWCGEKKCPYFPKQKKPVWMPCPNWRPAKQYRGPTILSMVMLIVALGLLCAVGIPTRSGIDSTIMNAGRAFVCSMLLLAGLAVLIDLQNTIFIIDIGRLVEAFPVAGHKGKALDHGDRYREVQRICPEDTAVVTFFIQDIELWIERESDLC